MEELEPNTPVIVGVGFFQERKDDPLECLEPYQLMVQAVRNAAQDAGSSSLLAQIDSISVMHGSWDYPNPGKLIADTLGCPSAKSILAELGVLQLMLLSDLCQAIIAGEQQIGVLTGGEARYRELRAKITQQPISNTQQPADTPAPDLHHQSSDPFCSEVEAKCQIYSPVEYFAIIESALRYHEGLGIEEHRDKIATLYSEFSEIAARNPHAWRQEPMSAEEIRNPSEKNPMIAVPYTKNHSSRWNVNQAVAIIVCAAGKAKELGLDQARWIYPISASQSRQVFALAEQRDLHSKPGTVMSGKRAYALAGISPEEVNAADLYSCFPSSVRSFALDLQLQEGCPLSVTGSMAFAGGPLNHSSFDGVARMVEVLRTGEEMAACERRIGLVSILSGIFGKQACALFSNVPNSNGYGFGDVTDAVAEEVAPVALNGDYVGKATIAGYTVVYDKEDASHAFAYCDAPDGERTVVRTNEEELLARMIQEEFCGREVQILSGGRFSAAE
jgi:acetyl-CoA C-acetyltransferase